MKVFLLILALGFILASCKKDDKDEPINVNLSIVVNGSLSNYPIVQYNNSNGQLQMDTLNGNWNKTMTVESGFELLVKTTGTLLGDINMTATANGNGNSYSDTRSDSYAGTPDNFDLEIQTILE